MPSSKGIVRSGAVAHSKGWVLCRIAGPSLAKQRCGTAKRSKGIVEYCVAKQGQGRAELSKGNVKVVMQSKGIVRQGTVKARCSFV